MVLLIYDMVLLLWSVTLPERASIQSVLPRIAPNLPWQILPAGCRLPFGAPRHKRNPAARIIPCRVEFTPYALPCADTVSLQHLRVHECDVAAR